MLSPASPTRSSREEQLFRLAQIVEAASLSSDPACAHLSPKDVQRQWLEKGVRQAQMVPRQLERVSASRGKEPVRTEQDAAAVVGRSLAGRPSGSGGGAKLAVVATVCTLIIAAPLLLPSLSPSPPPLSPPPPPARLMEITFDVIPVPLALRDSEAVPHTHESRKLASALSLEELTTLLRDRLPPEVDPRAVALRRHGSSFSVSISTPSTDTFAVLEVD